MHSKDLYELGAEAYTQGFHYYAHEWFKASLAKYELEDNEFIYFNFNKETILEKTIENKKAQGDYHVALKYIKELLQHNRENEKAHELYKDIEEILAFSSFKMSPPVPKNFVSIFFKYFLSINNLIKTCKITFRVNHEMTSKLKHLKEGVEENSTR